jgi:mRNA-degrading endonuclease RelE of RelBE toxin-antitoxin system
MRRRDWLFSVIGWDGCLPVLVAASPTLLSSILPQRDLAELTAMIVVPIIAALLRAHHGRRQFERRGILDLSGKSGYSLARIAFEIVLAPEAVDDLRRLKARDRARVRDAMEVHLRHEPTRVSRSRIKRLQGLSHPQYRLRVDALRVFYDVTGEEVQVLAIIAKPDADAWLAKEGQSDEDRPSVGGEG